MQFLADENMDALVVRNLRAAGYDIEYIAELAPGIDDQAVLARSVADQRILMTEDLDFCDMVFRDQAIAYGIILLRILPEQRALKSPRLLHLIQTLATTLPAALTTLTMDSIRSRPLPKP
jgi:predicted nuclease of predicted toxin-antitoxin system